MDDPLRTLLIRRGVAGLLSRLKPYGYEIDVNLSVLGENELMSLARRVQKLLYLEGEKV